jgi:hypothetical protein
MTRSYVKKAAWLWVLVGITSLALMASGCSSGKSWKKAPAMQIDPSKPYFATVDTTLGSFKIQLFASESPKTVNNFVFLSQQGFYNGVIFHRVIKSFMIQTGDPRGRVREVRGMNLPTNCLSNTPMTRG